MFFSVFLVHCSLLFLLGDLTEFLHSVLFFCFSILRLTTSGFINTYPSIDFASGRDSWLIALVIPNTFFVWRQKLASAGF